MAVIGIIGTPYNFVEKSPFWWNKVTYTRQAFVDVFQKLGHTAIIIPVGKPEEAKNYIPLVDKILLTGGSDIAPQFYGEEPDAALETTDYIRDKFELAMIDEALKADKAIFGICRGMQILNVYFGGNLYQNLTSKETSLRHRQATTPQNHPTHSVKINPESSLGFLPEHYMVNSYHHQAVKNLGSDLTAIAHATDGLVEAVENKEKRVLAVQWHPEGTWEDIPEELELFKYFTEKL